MRIAQNLIDYDKKSWTFRLMIIWLVSFDIFYLKALQKAD